jgi:hypothetical protein
VLTRQVLVGCNSPRSDANQDQSSCKHADLAHLNSPVDFGLTAYPVTLATLNSIGIVEMSRPDDLVSSVSPHSARA